MKKIRLFSLKGGIELMDFDLMESMQGQSYLFYSFGKYLSFVLFYLIIGEVFDHSVRMEFI